MTQLARTTIKYMFPYIPAKNKFKYCFEMTHFGGNQRDELELWCKENDTRFWGNMGYVRCQTDEDAIDFINTWGINFPRKYKTDVKNRCSVCKTTENVGYVGGYQPYRCLNPDCIPF
jgi:hypothetical protein